MTTNKYFVKQTFKIGAINFKVYLKNLATSPAGPGLFPDFNFRNADLTSVTEKLWFKHSAESEAI